METKQALSNTFTDGLNTDLHPLITPNTVLTDCINGTIMTNNGNEYSLQNDFGNYELKNAKLPVHYVPIGIKEYNGILYIVSYNPITKRSQIGTFPSPQQTKISESDTEMEIDQIIINPHTADTYLEDKNCFYSKYKASEQSIYLDDTLLRANDLYKFVVDGSISEPFQSIRLQVVNQSGKSEDLDIGSTSDFVRFDKTVNGNLKLSNSVWNLETMSISSKNIIFPTSTVDDIMTNDLLSVTLNATVKVNEKYKMTPMLEINVRELDEQKNILASKTFYANNAKNRMINAGIVTYGFKELVSTNIFLKTRYIEVDVVPYVTENGKTIVYDTYCKQLNIVVENDKYSHIDSDYDPIGEKNVLQFIYKVQYVANVGPVLHFDIIWNDESIELNGTVVESRSMEYALYPLYNDSGNLKVGSTPVDMQFVSGQNLYKYDPDSQTFEVDFNTNVPLEEMYVFVFRDGVSSRVILRTLVIASESINAVENFVTENMNHLSDYSRELTFDIWAKASNLQFDYSYEKVFEREQYVKSDSLDALKHGDFIAKDDYFKIDPIYKNDLVVGNFIKTTNRFKLNSKYNSGSGLWESPELETSYNTSVKTTFADTTFEERIFDGDVFDIDSISGTYCDVTKDTDTISHTGKKYYLINECPFRTIDEYVCNSDNEINAYYFKKQSNTSLITDLYKSQNSSSQNTLNPFEPKEVRDSLGSFTVPLNAIKLTSKENISVELHNELDSNKMFFNPIFIDGFNASGYSVPHYTKEGLSKNPIMKYGSSTIGLKTSGEKTTLTVPMWGRGCNTISPWMYDYKDQIKIMQLLACNIYAYRKQDIIVAESNLIALGENSMLRTSSVDVNLRATVTIKDLKYKGVDLIKNKDNILSACGITPERCGILNSRNGATKTFEQYQLLVQGVTTEENVFKTEIQRSLQDAKAEVNELKVALENNSVVYSDISSTSDALLQYVKEFAENLEFKNDCFYLKSEYNNNKIEIKPQSYSGSTTAVENYCGGIMYNEWNYEDNANVILQCAGVQNNILSLRNNDLTEKWSDSEIQNALANLSQSFKDAINNEG